MTEKRQSQNLFGVTMNALSPRRFQTRKLESGPLLTEIAELHSCINQTVLDFKTKEVLRRNLFFIQVENHSEPLSTVLM